MIEFLDLHRRSFRLLVLAILLIQTQAVACIWDSDTLSQERRAHPKLAEAILSSPSSPTDLPAIKKRIEGLLANRQENEPAWWNELAGAHLRLGNATEAARILEPLLGRFGTNYGIRANLGTAYHLLGRYQDAERLISLNVLADPNAHFGLEKYHLALLQYLSRDSNYQRFHVYVDEFTDAFLSGGIMAFPSPRSFEPNISAATTAALRIELMNQLAGLRGTDRQSESNRRHLQQRIAQTDAPPEYTASWDLAGDPKLEDGIIYMASLNPRQPACFVMLGMRALQKRDLNLTVKAFERAVQLGSPQSDLLESRIKSLTEHIRTAQRQNRTTFLIGLAIALPATVLLLILLRRWRASRSSSRQS